MRSLWSRACGLVAIVCLLFNPNPAHADAVSGTISSDATWTLAGNPWVITDSVTVAPGTTLTIEPGVIVKFDSGTILVIGGKLVAAGTAANPITFTSSLASPSPGSWRNLTFLSSSDANSVLAYCFFEYGGSGTNGATVFYATGAPNIRIANTTIRYSAGHGVNVRASSPRISASIFRENVGYGIYSDLVTSLVVDSTIANKNIQGGIRIPINSSPTITYTEADSNGIGIFIDNSSSPTIQNNKIRHNTVGIQFTGVGTTQPTITQNTITNNTNWGFLNTSTSTTVLARNNYWGSDAGPFHSGLNPTGLGNKVSDYVDFQPWVILAPPLSATEITANTISVNTTWESGVFWIKTSSGNTLTVNSGITLTIKPGVIVKFAGSKRLTINGTLIADGTPDSIIVFTSERDDPYGGDTNGDSGGSSPSRGIWDMVYLNGGGNNSSVIDHCLFRYGGSSGNGNVRIDGRTPVVTNSSFTQSANYGLYLQGGANGSVSSCTFGANSVDGILIQSSNPQFNRIRAFNNGRYGIYANSGSIQFSVRASILNNNSYGIVADAGSAGATLVSLDSSVISNNINGGLYLWYGLGPQYFGYNRISNNGAYGLWCFNVNDIVTMEGDTITNNGEEAIITSKARINNNVIQGNRYPIALFGRLGSFYSGNTISGNTFNNVMALRVNRTEESFSDTLKFTVPSGMLPGTYVFIENSPGWGVVGGSTLRIEPGVKIKMNPGMYLRIEGTLLADASGGDPIIFTSYRDATAGGKTNSATDNSASAPGDWRYIRIRTSSANNTVLNNVIFKFGGMDGWGNLWLESTLTLATPVRNIVSRKSSVMGIRVSDGVVTFENVAADSNGTYGIFVEGNRPSNVVVRNSVLQDNGSGQGLRAADNSAFSEISNCTIRRNGSWGIGVDNGTIPQTYSGNTITFNGAGGIWNNSSTIPANSLLYIGNTITDHPNEGILTSRARLIDNRIERNRYPLAVWRATGNIYTDNNGADGNIITGNLYNNAIAIWDGEIFDTLKVTFPQAITSRTYVAIYDFQVNSGRTLVIEPGVRIKFQQIPTNDWQALTVHGTLIAEGTPANPIVFTSWRDSTVGGKTTALTDFGVPAPGDWHYVWFRNGSGASRIRYCEFKFGGRSGIEAAVRFEDNVSSIVFSNNLIRKSLTAGMFIIASSMTIDSTTIDSCSSYGIRAYQDNRVNLILRHSKMNRNGSYGLYVESPGKVSLVTNNQFIGNNASGVYINNNTVPLSFFSNTIDANNGHGVVALLRNDAVDSLLMVVNNTFTNNALVGLYSSRAYVVDNSFTGNRYAIGVLGQISLTGTGTANGNVYQNNTITSNTLNDILVTQESTFGVLGGSFPAGYTSKVIAVRGDLTVPGGESMTIKPGTIIKFPIEYGSGRFQVDGSIISEGTSASKIVFTSWKDDSFGGDTNGDANGSVPAPGDWDRLLLNGSQNNASRIFQTIFRYGGRSGNGNVHWSSTTAPMDSSFSSFSSNYGLYMNSASPLVTATEIHSNPTGILLQGSANPVFHTNNIRDNSTYGINNNTNNVIDATNNYWGAASGPFVNQGSDQNLTGTGNRILLNPAAVNYRPFLTSRSGILLGDVSQDGTISAYDAALILQHTVTIITLGPSQLAAADVSGSGGVTAFDASLILQHVVGIITGFPGSGKLAGESTLASAFSFRTERPSQSEIHLILNLKKTEPIFATEMTIGFPSGAVQPSAVQKTGLSDKMVMESRFEEGTVRISMAGTHPITEEGDIMRLVFHLKEGRQGTPAVEFDVKRLLLNEKNVTNEASGVVVGVDEKEQIPTTFGLDQNFPNPFNPVTKIRYHLPVAGTVSIVIFDMLGREVRQLVQAEQPAGSYTVRWDGTDSEGKGLPSGSYFYRIKARGENKESFTHIRKMVLVK